MAAVTVNRRREAVIGSQRIIMADVSIANNGDTFNTSLKIINGMSADGGSAAAVTGVSATGGTMTFLTAGAVTHAQVVAIGW
jgi:hypothetical protein